LGCSRAQMHSSTLAWMNASSPYLFSQFFVAEESEVKRFRSPLQHNLSKKVEFLTIPSFYSLYLRKFILRAPYLHRFRVKPAISEFDWLFTPIHSSSETNATVTCAGKCHSLPCPWIAHSVSGLI
jgi:hypothetical protein